ncbi:MAG: hydrogenase large subunit [Candidatus Dormibacteria bacterium]
MTTAPSARAAADSAGVQVRAGSQDELVAVCREEDMEVQLGHLVEVAGLADWFATTPVGRQPRLTAVLEVPGDPTWLIVHTDLSRPEFPSLTASSHAASWYERDMLEMHGVVPLGHPAPAPLRQPEATGHHSSRARPHLPTGGSESHGQAMGRPAVTGQGVFQLPLGPVRSGPQESGAFSFASGGEDIVVVDMSLGFKFRGLERLAEGRPAADVIQLAERLAGTSSFANALAFSRAAERALGAVVAPPEEFTRTLFAEMERIHSHLGTIGRLAEATGLLVASAQYGLLKEEALRAAGRMSGHRYLRGVLRLGGTELVPERPAREWLHQQVGDWITHTRRLRHLLQETSTFVDRLEGTAFLRPEYAAEHYLVGPVGRACAIDRDVRRDHPYAAYSQVDFQVPTFADGDAKARYEVHALELEQSLGIIHQLLAEWPADAPPPEGTSARPGSALGWAEAPGGQALHFVALDEEGLVTSWRARPPAVVNWHPFAHACASGNNLTDFPVIEASFALSHAEFDR